MKLSVQRRSLRLARPLHTAYGELAKRVILAVSITDRAGATGHGEAAPLEPYDGVSLEQVELALARYAPVLEAHDDDAAGTGEVDHSSLLQACRGVDACPSALAAIDIALWDRAGRIRERPVAALLNERHAPAVAVNATLSALDLATLAEQAASAAGAGFSCLKLKVGLGGDDARVAAVRSGAGPDMALRLDANGAWSVDQAVCALETLVPAGLELIEEPVHGLEATRELRARVQVRISIDETAAEPGALTAGVADAVCLKVSRCGGISGVIAAAAAVRASGAVPYLSSSLDGPVGTAAALHAAAAIAAEAPLPHCGLATLGMFAGLEHVLPPHGGEMRLPPGAGLGVDPL